ncbi:MAG: hypothetical protein OIF50_12190, partial [Flavobacteriaceae bacterium]|nr:hypothetical protein [Flavobacteriaceae bacterium]
QSKYYKANHAAITKNAIAVIDYVSNYISWKGQLDFVVNFKEAEGDGLVSSYSGTTNQGYTFAQSEAITGQDVNGRDFDIGAHIIPDAKGKLTNYGYNLYFDPNPQPYSKADIPSGNHDFFSIYLHEVIHGLGLWSVAQYNTGQASTFFDRQTIEKNGQFFFTGSKTQALLGTPLPLSVKGSRDNYATNKSGENSPIDRGVMFEYGNYEQNRWHLGKVDLAILEDLGHKIANQKNLPLVEKLGDLDIGALITKTEDGGKQFLGGIGNDIFKGT